MMLHVCRGSDLHPYECDGPGKCIHCDRKRTKHHRPSECWLCHETLKRHPKNCQMCATLKAESGGDS